MPVPAAFSETSIAAAPCAPLELLDGLESIEGHARQFVTRQIGELRRQRRAHAIEQHRKLRENHDLVPAAHDLRKLLKQEIDFARIA